MNATGQRANMIVRYLPSRNEPSDTNLPSQLNPISANQNIINKQGQNETGLREIIDIEEIKNLKAFDKELEKSK